MTSAVPVLEADVQKLITDACDVLGWSWVHFRPAQTSRGWRTPVSGPLGKGFVDLVLANPRRRTTVFVEVKGSSGRLSDEQRQVHEVLRDAGLTVEVVGPADVDRFILEVLNR